MTIKAVSYRKKRNSKASSAPPKNQFIPKIDPSESGSGGVAKPGPRKSHRTDITLQPSVAEAVRLHAAELQIPQNEYHRLAISAFFKECLINPPEPAVAFCPTCGRQKRTMHEMSGFKRVRIGVRFDTATAKFLESLADDFFCGTWSRVFEASMRFFLGDLNPPPEGFGKIPGVKMTQGRPPGKKSVTTVNAAKRLARIEAQIRAAENNAKETADE